LRRPEALLALFVLPPVVAKPLLLEDVQAA
jgi:hypothetical protein